MLTLDYVNAYWAVGALALAGMITILLLRMLALQRQQLLVLEAGLAEQRDAYQRQLQLHRPVPGHLFQPPNGSLRFNLIWFLHSDSLPFFLAEKLF